MEGAEPYCHIFLFINSSSGGGVGQKLVAQEIQKMSFHINLEEITSNKQDQIIVYFYNMRKNKDKGFNNLKKLTENKKKTFAIVCGGDGTVMWVVSQLINYKIDLQLVPIAVIPLGTGNDFSRNLGWGKQQTTLTQNSFQTLKSLIKDWIKAEQGDLDIWQVTATTYQWGSFQKVVDQKDKIMEQKKIQKNFCNYFSFGIDGKVGYQFDKYRTTSRLGNLAVYGAMGLASNFQKFKNIGELIDCVLDYSDGKGQVIFYGQKVKSLQQLFGKNIFEFKVNFNQVVQNIKNSLTLNNYQNIVALNINSYMGGVVDIWKKANQDQLLKRHHKPNQSSHSDGLIQFVSFASTVSIGLQKTVNKFSQVGFSSKFAQGKGPFYFKFKENKQDKNHHTYLQIDGEFIKINHPDFIQIKRSTQIPNGKIRVLQRKQ